MYEFAPPCVVDHASQINTQSAARLRKIDKKINAPTERKAQKGTHKQRVKECASPSCQPGGATSESGGTVPEAHSADGQRPPACD